MRSKNYYFFSDGSLSHECDRQTSIFKCRAWVKEDMNRKIIQVRKWENGEITIHIYRNEEIYNQAMVIWRGVKEEEIPNHIKMMQLIGVI